MKGIQNMTAINVDDLVINHGDRSVVGQVLSTSEAVGGLHCLTDLDTWDTGTAAQFSDSGLVPVRWNTDDGVPYEWWEAPEFLVLLKFSETEHFSGANWAQL